MEAQLNRIREKLSQLKSLDTSLQVFGAEIHQYQLYKKKTEQELIDFEQLHQVKLPTDYREFLKNIGNGGAGPNYGLEPLENGKFADLDYKSNDDLIDLTKPFPHTQAWNMEFEEMNEESEEEYFDNQWINGLLRISNSGCGTSINLVVNGKEFGNLWIDGRCNSQGIYPDSQTDKSNRISFLNWYEAWLDTEILKIEFDNYF